VRINTILFGESQEQLSDAVLLRKGMTHRKI
jgi:hypothetical protein